MIIPGKKFTKEEKPDDLWQYKLIVDDEHGYVKCIF